MPQTSAQRKLVLSFDRKLTSSYLKILNQSLASLLPTTRFAFEFMVEPPDFPPRFFFQPPPRLFVLGRLLPLFDELFCPLNGPVRPFVPRDLNPFPPPRENLRPLKKEI
jgi:hypothetical protein